MSGPVRLTALEVQVLGAWEGADLNEYMNFHNVAEWSEVPRQQIRRVVRALARKGLTEYGKGLWTEEGRMAGAGYRITDAGRRALSEGGAS